MGKGFRIERKEKQGLKYRYGRSFEHRCGLSVHVRPGTRQAVRGLGAGMLFRLPQLRFPGMAGNEDRNMLMKPERLAEEVLRVDGIEGVTVSGGEPMLQAKNLAKFVRLVRAKRAATVVCYAGFTLEGLRARKDKDVSAFLAEIDVLIDGPYVEELNDNKGWRGSTNQAVHFLAGVYRDREREFIGRRRDMEIHLFEKHYLAVGIHPKNMDYAKFL